MYLKEAKTCVSTIPFGLLCRISSCVAVGDQLLTCGTLNMRVYRDESNKMQPLLGCKMVNANPHSAISPGGGYGRRRRGPCVLLQVEGPAEPTQVSEKEQKMGNFRG